MTITLSAILPSMSATPRAAAAADTFGAILNETVSASDIVGKNQADNAPDLMIDDQIDMLKNDAANMAPETAKADAAAMLAGLVPLASAPDGGAVPILNASAGNDNLDAVNTPDAAPTIAVAQVIAVLTPNASVAPRKAETLKMEGSVRSAPAAGTTSSRGEDQFWRINDAPRSADADKLMLSSAISAAAPKADSAFAAMTADASAMMSLSATTSAATNIAPSPTPTNDLRQLYLASDGQWIDTLRNEIVNNATRDNQLQFTLKPEHLGKLDIALICTDGQIDIRMDASTAAAAQIIAADHAHLVEELRNAGVKVGQFDMTNGQNGARQQQRPQQDVPANDIHPTITRPADSKVVQGRFA